MSRSLSPRYFLASIALVLLLVTLYSVSAARFTQRDLLKQLEEKGLALAEALAISSRNAIQGDRLMEEMIAQRLLDNARLVDQLLLARPLDPSALARITAMNRLQRVELLDLEGRPYGEIPAPERMRGHQDMMRMMMERRRAGDGSVGNESMMMYMWGRRWGRGGDGAPPAVADRKFWEGSLFGVAVGARSFPGIIAVHADADYVLDFRERQRLLTANRELREALTERHRVEGIIGESGPMQEVLSLVRRVASSDATVLIRGESGTGKELIAKAIHYASPRAGGRWSRSTAPRFRIPCSNPSCSATRRAPSPERSSCRRRGRACCAMTTPEMSASWKTSSSARWS